MAVDVSSTRSVVVAVGDGSPQFPDRDDEKDSRTDDYEAGAEPVVDDIAPRPRPGARLAVYAGFAIVLVLAVLNGWLFVRWDQSRAAQHQQAEYLAAARQGALNLTTIDYTEVDADVARILDSSTGAFRDDFARRSQPFVDVVKQAQSKSVGMVTEAGVESVHDGRARVLVAISVKTSTPAAPDEQPRLWRMQIDVQAVGDAIKVSNVEFVP